MSKADQIFVSMCRNVLETGTDTKDEIVRPHWPDGTPAYTIKKFCVVNRYDLREEFPAITLRWFNIKSTGREVYWIWQKKSNNVKDLGLHIWDAWADEDGSINKSYGYQAGRKYQFKEGVLDQVDDVIWQLKNTPFSRRIIMTTWIPEDLIHMNLQPCAHTCNFVVTKEPGCDKLILNMILNQRSQDILAANAWNVAQYAILQMSVAQACDMIAGEFVHVIADAHIYDRHVPIIKELIQRKQYPAPKVTLDPAIKNFYDFTPDSIIIENYVAGDPIEKFEVAI